MVHLDLSYFPYCSIIFIQVALLMINVVIKVFLSFVSLTLQNSCSQLVSLTQQKGEKEVLLDFLDIINENKNARIFNDHCSLRIYGGTDVAIQSVPYQISLRRGLLGGMYWFSGCGGALVTLKFVMTAAHCFVGPDFPKIKNNIRAVAGSTRTDASLYTMMREHWRRIKHYYPHKHYDPSTYMHDLAILEVMTPFFLSVRVKPIRIHSYEIRLKMSEGMNCLVTGYGYISKTKRASRLQKVCVPLVTRYNCSFYYHPKYLHDSVFCAGTKGKDSCNGDSGGPIVCHGVLVGLVSYGGECGVDPGVYTRLSSYTHGEPIPFILKQDNASNGISLNRIVLLFLLAINIL